MNPTGNCQMRITYIYQSDKKIHKYYPKIGLQFKYGNVIFDALEIPYEE